MWIYRYHPYMGDMASPMQRGHPPYHQMQQEQHQEEMMQTTDVMDSNNMSIDPHLASMHGPPQDIKPDISQLNIITSSSGYSNHHPPMTQPPPGYPTPSQIMACGFSSGHQNPAVSQPGYFSMGHLQMSPGSQVSPPGTHHSPSLHSPSGLSMTSPPPSSLTPLQSPTSTMGSPSGLIGGMTMNQAHSTFSTKHICAICGDRASGKHYGVYSCEGCKGFFKRTVRKDLTYACRDDRSCQIDKRQRNRCQYCRYMKCLSMGMKREAVQEERQRGKEKGEGEVESTSSANSEMPVERILEAELSVEPKNCTYIDAQKDAVTNICQAADKQLFTLVEWAKMIPHFSELPVDDQVILLRAGWNELLIAGFSHRSIAVTDGILLSTGLHVHRSTAHHAGVGAIFDRVLTELVAKMRELKMDKTELGCLRAIVLFNPDAKALSSMQEVELLREKVYASLEEYCKTQYPEEPGRFAKLLLRLPALRSIGLKCMEHLFFFKLIGDAPIDTFLMEMLETPSQCA